MTRTKNMFNIRWGILPGPVIRASFISVGNMRISRIKNKSILVWESDKDQEYEQVSFQYLSGPDLSLIVQVTKSGKMCPSISTNSEKV
jgi:hypothetical protein